jgi:hypothetical protein
MTITIQYVKRRGCIPSFALLFLCCLNATSFGQRVTIRIINLTNGSPLINEPVYISGISSQKATKEDEAAKLTRKPLQSDLSLVTDSKGETSFELPKPAPAYLYIRAVFSERDWDCTCLVRVPAEEILQKGYIVMSPYAARKSKPSLQPTAGEVLFVMRRTPWWWRILYPLEKG